MFSAVLRHPICVSMIAPLPPSERVIKRPIETYEISREKKKIYLIVRISCTLIQPIHSVIWYETPHQNFHHYYNSRLSNLFSFLFPFANPNPTAPLRRLTSCFPRIRQKRTAQNLINMNDIQYHQKAADQGYPPVTICHRKRAL